MAVDSACSYRLPSLKFVGDTFSVSTLTGLLTLTFDLLTSNLVHIIVCGMGNLLRYLLILLFLGLFVLDLSANTCLSDEPRDLATL